MNAATKSTALRERGDGVGAASVEQLAARLQGQLLFPDSSGYDRARRVFNAMIDRRPAMIVRCASPEDAVEGVSFARAHGLPMSVKGGGHGVAGNAVCDRGLTLDLSPMKAVRVDPVKRTATVQAGATLADLDRATQRFGLATPTGVVSVTGLAGLALGGGLGWLNGKHGLTCDNLLAAEVVTATGAMVVADVDESPELLWGLRGGGGNFGVATSFKLQLHPVDSVLAGHVTFPARKAQAALRYYHEFASGCPDELTTMASVAQRADCDVVVSIAVCYAGPIGRGEKLLAPLRSLGPETDAIGPMPYRALQQASDEGFPPGQQHYWKAVSLTGLGDQLIDIMIESVARMPSPTSGLGLQHLHGAASSVDPGATAFPHRESHYDCLILSQWPDPAEAARNIAWTRELFEAIRRHAAAGVYINNLGEDEAARVKQAYGLNYDRLVMLKRECDPTNFFSQNHNIDPAVRPD
jgi:FAD/FMN-containing dehydrogenase